MVEAAHKTVIVTGGTGALGSAVCLELLSKGWDVAATYRTESSFTALTRQAAELSAGLSGYPVDLQSADDVDGFAGVISVRNIKGIVNVVGGFAGGSPIHQSKPELLDEQISINLKTLWLSHRYLVPLLIQTGGGSIVNIATRAASEPAPGIAAYAASKAAVVSLSLSAAEELQSENIRVNCLVPSTIDTSANRAAMPKADFTSWTSPDKIASVVSYLLSEDASAVTGALIPV